MVSPYVIILKNRCIIISSEKQKEGLEEKVYINLHCHTDHSNYRMLDSINRIEDLFEYTHELGHKGLTITDHETVGNHVQANL